MALFDQLGSNANDYANLGGWNGPAANSITAGAGGGFFGNNLMQNLFGGTAANGTQSIGAVAPVLGIGSALLGGFQGAKKLKLAEGQLKEGKRQFDLNYDAQRKTTNTQLEDRQRARVASSPGAYESVSTYLDKNRV